MRVILFGKSAALFGVCGLIFASVSVAQAGDIQTMPGNGVLDFELVRIGTTATLPITAFRIGNPTGGALSGTFPAASGVFSPNSTLAFGPIASNGAAAGVTRNYSFTPTAHGLSTQNLTITSNLGDASLTLTGTGVGPIYDSTAAPNSTIDFGGVNIGESAQLPLDVTNLSNETGSPSSLTDLTLLSATITGPDAALFSILGFTDDMVLSELDIANLFIQFDPAGPPGPKTATLTILTDQGAALGQPGESFVYNLQGEALQQVVPTTPVPEPTSLALWGVSGLGIAVAARRRKRAQAS